MKLSWRDRRAVLVGAAALLAVFLVRYALIPWIHSWQAARGRVAAARAELDDVRSTMQRLLRVRDRTLATYGQAVAKPLEDVEATRIAFLKTVQDVLRAGGVEYKSIDPQPTKALRELPGVEWVPCEVKGSCQLAQLAKCLAELRKAEKLVIVDRITASGGEKEPGKLEVSLVLATLAEQGKAGS
jgi:hypothetical protein